MEVCLDSESIENGFKGVLKCHKMCLGFEFERLRTQGVKEVGRYLLMVWYQPETPELKIGVICSRKFHKHAIKRNRARRMIWESMRLLQVEHLGLQKHLLFIPRKAILLAKQPEIQKEISALLFRSGLFKGPGISG